jgi:hypothetical protein
MNKPDREIFIRRSHRQLGADVAQGSGGATALHKSDESRSVTASVSIAAWPALCGNNNAGGF